MRARRLPALFILAGAIAGGAPADDSLEAALLRMDAVAATFKGLTANIQRTAHVQLANSDMVDEGTVAVQRSKQGDLGKYRAPLNQFLLLGFGSRSLDLKNADFNVRSRCARPIYAGAQARPAQGR